MTAAWRPHLGAVYLGGGSCRFRVWAPRARRVEVHLVEPVDRLAPLEPGARGYFEAVLTGVEPGALYFYRLDEDKERPDPVSRLQPRGVHGPSAVIDRSFPWADAGWRGVPLEECVFYELHVGTFTPEGTFEAIIPHLDGLAGLGITAIELMPVAQFPGDRNWGYDGVYLHAAQNSYGGPDGLRRLVDACHARGIAVVLDVVYNHLGPEGNYLWDYGHYFTDEYRTPWGPAVNFDGPHSDEVRAFFLENALAWQADFHIDALRLDAVHAIKDFSAYPFLRELADRAGEQARLLGRPFFLIAESSLNDTRLLRPPELGGFGLDGQWADDFHHGIRTLLAGDRDGYYEDYGTVEDLARAFRTGWTFEGQYSPYRKRRHGDSAGGRPARQFVVCSQNHDQVGNRMMGDRLGRDVSFEALKVAAGAVLLSPFLPMLFMGEEYAEPAPFPFFTSHGDPGLIEAVRKGRREEFASFSWQGEPPDPQDEKTFHSARLRHDLREQSPHREMLAYYAELLRLRREVPALELRSKDHQEVQALERQKCLLVRRWSAADQVCLVLHFGNEPVEVRAPLPAGRWEKVLASVETRWGGPGDPHPDQLSSDGEVALAVRPLACLVYRRSEER